MIPLFSSFTQFFILFLDIIAAQSHIRCCHLLCSDNFVVSYFSLLYLFCCPIRLFYSLYVDEVYLTSLLYSGKKLMTVIISEYSIIIPVILA